MFAIRTSIATAFAIVALGGSVALAQLSSAQRETLNVSIGSIFEIQAAIENTATANWVLTENGKFIEASREHVFRTRFSREGTYVLSVEVDTHGNTIERIFTLEVRARRPEDAMIADGSKGIVTFDPVLTNNQIDISTTKQVVTITPVRADVKVLAIDLDTSVDSNDDGNTENDEDTKNTLFRSEGNPLRIWFVNGQSKNIRFGALLEDSKTTFQSISVGSINSPQPPSQIPNSVQEPTTTLDANTDFKILVLKSDNGEVQYALRRPVDETEPILLLWDFGDGTQSMLDRPIHSYPKSGRYDVTVEMRNLRTGTVIGTIQDSLMVNRLKDETPTDNPDEPTDQPSNKGGSSLLGLVFKLIFSLIGFALLGALIMFVVGKLKKKNFSLEKTMEKAEKTIVKTPSSDVNIEPPPMEIAAEPVEQEAPPPPPEPEPKPVENKQDTSSTSDWLSSGIEATQANEVTPVEAPVIPTPEPVQPVEPAVEVAPNVSHEPMQPKAEDLQADSTNAPSWLQQGMQQAEAIGQTPTAPPPPNLQDKTLEPLVTPPTESVAPTAPTPTEKLTTTEVSTTENTVDLEKDAAAKEKKRKKRQRYRENLKKRKAEGGTSPAKQLEEQSSDSNEPIAFIKAEDIEPMEATPETPVPPTEQGEHDEKGA